MATALVSVAWPASLSAGAGRQPASPAPRPASERVSANDNQRSAGTPAGDVLTIRLDARVGQWHPDGEAAPGVRVNALAVEGQPLQVPAPLIRVREGMQIHAVVSNRLEHPLTVHGLHTRPGTGADGGTPLVVPPGETRDVRFAAGAAGTYFYWAATQPAASQAARVGVDSQLSGAFVVDPAGAAAEQDRVLVITRWNNGRDLRDAARVFRYAINGRSWPHTERLAYAVGDQVRMHLINAGGGVHPMHLHGFYFNVDGRGTETAFTPLAAGAPPRLVVTERMPPGATFTLAWTPTRPGNWLFHCHDTAHIVHGGPLEGTPAPAADAHRHVENHALEMMAGPVMGITVTGASAEGPEPGGPRRQLRLTVREDAGGTEKEPAFAYALDDGTRRAGQPLSAVGPTIILKRGEPVSITVANELRDPTSVHWHGIELESYFDGVPGYAGLGTRIAPAVAPGGTFDARFTPPRSGTFMYHTHVDELRQQQGGLSGALLVVDDPSAYDPAHDLVLVVTVPRTAADSATVLLNGSSTPPPLEWRAGERYRLRFVNLHTFRPGMRMRLMSGSTLATWRGIAKDGMDLPSERRVDAPAEVQMGNGESYDFEFTPTRDGDLRLDITQGDGLLLLGVPVAVR